jgi:hypothetical protein
MTRTRRKTKNISKVSRVVRKTSTSRPRWTSGPSATASAMEIDAESYTSSNNDFPANNGSPSPILTCPVTSPSRQNITPSRQTISSQVGNSSWPLGITYHASAKELHFLQYHAEILCTLLVNADCSNNPLRQVVLPRAITSSMLRHAVCSVAAWHMSTSFVGKEDVLQAEAMSYYMQALSKLNSTIRRMKTDEALDDVVVSEESLLTSIFLCKYEIMKGGVVNWQSHLSGIEGLLDHFKASRRNLTVETLDYAKSLYAQYHCCSGVRNLC